MSKNTQHNVHGVMAEFKGPREIMQAAEHFRDAGYKDFEVYTPFPVHGMDRAMGLKPSKLAWFVLCGGATGLAFGLTLQTWVATSAYKLTISGKPFFSYQAFVPVCFELMVLFSAFTAVFGMLIMNGLPRWYHSVFKHSTFHKASSHGFFLCIEARDKKFDQQASIDLLQGLGATNIEVVED